MGSNSVNWTKAYGCSQPRHAEPMTGESLGEITMTGKIVLRLKLFIRNMHVDRDESLVIRVREPREIEVRYRRPNATEIAEGSDLVPAVSLGDTVCDSTGEWEPSGRNRDALATLAKEGVGELTEEVVVFGRVEGRTGMPAWDALPPTLQEFLHSAESELARAASKTQRLLRWFLALQGEHDPFRLWSFAWSPDGKHWQDLPMKIPMRSMDFVPTLRPLQNFAEAIERAMEQGRDEPVAHELLREALCRLVDSPRSALIVGIAAAEVGFKEFVSRTVPAAAWLVTEVPALPLVSMLTEYFPQLLASLKARPDLQFVAGRDKKGFYDPVLRELQRGISMRNQLVHRPARAPDTESVAPILAAVRDLLGMLDHYSGGTPLGESFISVSTRQVWWHPDAERRE